MSTVPLLIGRFDQWSHQSKLREEEGSQVVSLSLFLLPSDVPVMALSPP